MKPRPYEGQAESAWPRITRRLVRQHPLSLPTIREVALATWGSLWETTIGSGNRSLRLSQLRVPATIVGYFFEVLFAREMELRDPKLWRRGATKEDKDLVYLPDPSLSVEIKTSGQLGFKVYGNRSYGQKAQTESLVKKQKSGYYITVNFFERILTLLRFGWIDAEDWDPQQAPTGQMAGLGPSVYRHKLVCIPGAYRLRGPVELLDGIGQKRGEELRRHGIETIGDLQSATGALPGWVPQVLQSNRDLLGSCADDSPVE